jgi:dihydrofolate reductase
MGAEPPVEFKQRIDSVRKLILAINISLDGYADHTVGIADDELHDFFSGLLDETGIELFGRVTYQMMESYSGQTLRV